MKPEDFKPIGQIAQTETPGSRSVVGNNAGKVGAVASPADTSRVVEWLVRRRPADTDKAAASRASSHGVALRVRLESRYPSGQPSYDVAVGCDVRGTPAQIEAALSDLRNFMTPAPVRKIEGWLAELSVIVAKRAEDQFAEELRVSAYAARLSRYPADVVRQVLLIETYKFWPSWDELEKRCEALAGPRRHMIAALERGPEPREPQRRPATAEERAKIQAMVDELFPSHSQADRDAAVNHALSGNCMVPE